MPEIILAVGAGLLSFLSPCVLPLIPGYIAFISGNKLDELLEKKSINLLPIFMFCFLNYEVSKLSWLRALLYLNLVLMIVMPLNFQIGSNYMYLAEPPGVNNPLIIGEWPYYIIYWEFIILIFTYTTYVISTRKTI